MDKDFICEHPHCEKVCHLKVSDKYYEPDRPCYCPYYGFKVDYDVPDNRD